MLIGVTGTIGSGKGTVVSRLEKRGFRHVSVSGFLAGKLVERGIPATRVALRQIANEYRAKGATALIEAVLAEENPKNEDIAVESLHTVAEVEYIQHLGGTVIAVDAPLPLRWERVQKEGGIKDGSHDEFVREQDHQMASANPDENNLAAAAAAADFHIVNDGTLEEFFGKADAVIGEIV